MDMSAYRTLPKEIITKVRSSRGRFGFSVSVIIIRYEKASKAGLAVTNSVAKKVQPDPLIVSRIYAWDGTDVADILGEFPMDNQVTLDNFLCYGCEGETYELNSGDVLEIHPL